MIKDTEMTMVGRTRLEEGLGLEAESGLSRETKQIAGIYVQIYIHI